MPHLPIYAAHHQLDVCSYYTPNHLFTSPLPALSNYGLVLLFTTCNLGYAATWFPFGNTGPEHPNAVNCVDCSASFSQGC